MPATMALPSTHIYKYIRMYIQIHIYVCTQTHTHTHTYTRICTHKYMCMYNTYTHCHTHPPTHAQAQVHVRVHTHIHTKTHTHICSLTYIYDIRYLLFYLMVSHSIMLASFTSLCALIVTCSNSFTHYRINTNSSHHTLRWAKLRYTVTSLATYPLLSTPNIHCLLTDHHCMLVSPIPMVIAVERNKVINLNVLSPISPHYRDNQHFTSWPVCVHNIQL